MTRIAGVTLLANKRILIALTYIYGIGRSRAQEILDQAKVDISTRTQDLTPAEENKIRELIEKDNKILIEGDLRRERAGNIQRLKRISAYRGTRHAKRLPARGQHTRTNSRTVRGNVRITMGSGKRKEEKT